MNGPLDGVKVLDLSRLLPGPACTWILRGLGASVDRVEAPGAGDFTRYIPPFVDGHGAFFSATTRGKRSLALDLRKPGAADVVRRLVRGYDVLVEGFKPGVMEQMGLDPAQLIADQPGLVVARISGYGQTGPWRDRPGHDLNYVGITGALAFAAPSGSGGAAPLPVQVADLAGAMLAATGIAAAVAGVARGGPGRVLDVSLAEAALACLAPHIAMISAEGREPIAGGEILSGGVPMYGTYRCADGLWLTVGAVEPKFQAAVASATGATSQTELAAVFATKPRDQWVAELADACTGPALGVLELADHPQWRDRGAVQRMAGATWVRAPLTTGGIADEGPIPAVGEHTRAILAEAGFAESEIEAWA